MSSMDRSGKAPSSLIWAGLWLYKYGHLRSHLLEGVWGGGRGGSVNGCQVLAVWLPENNILVPEIANLKSGSRIRLQAVFSV